MLDLGILFLIIHMVLAVPGPDSHCPSHPPFSDKTLPFPQNRQAEYNRDGTSVTGLGVWGERSCLKESGHVMLRGFVVSVGNVPCRYLGVGQEEVSQV